MISSLPALTQPRAVSVETPIHAANLAMGISGGMSADRTRVIALTGGPGSAWRLD